MQATSTRTVSLNWLTESGGGINIDAVTGKIPVGNTSPKGGNGRWTSRRANYRSSHPACQTQIKRLRFNLEAGWIRLHFVNTLEEGVDQVEIYDADGNLFDTLTGLGR